VLLVLFFQEKNRGLGRSLKAFRVPVFGAYFSTVMTASGHIIAQKAQAIHFSRSIIPAGWKPFALSSLPDMAMILLGHTAAQSEHPLQRSVLKVTLGKLHPPCFRACLASPLRRHFGQFSAMLRRRALA
jgi:hypothetical protein